jgi:tetratricopeptide (TPR) repeat protein
MDRLKPTSLLLASVIISFSACSPQARETRALAQGKKEFQKKNYQVAIIQFKNAMASAPKDAEPYYQLGLAYLASNDFQTAGSYFHKATELNPKHTGAQLKLAELMSTSHAKDMVEDAQERTKDVLTLLPEDTEALDILAFTELRLGKPENAEAHLEEALRKSPNSLRSSIALAQARLARKDMAGAEDALKQATIQSPKSPDAWVYLGGLYLGLGRTVEAEQEYRHALAIDPKHGPSLLALAAMQVRAGHADQAEQTYRRVSALPEPQYKPIHALFLLQTGKRDQAVAEFEKLLKSDPDDRTIRTDLVRTYLALNRSGDAERILTAALKKNELDIDALLQRSRLYLASRKYTEAQNDLNQVLHFRNDSAEAHYLLSKVYQGHGEPALQRQELGQALKLDAKLLPVRLELAQTFMVNGAPQSTLRLLDEAPPEQKGTIGVILKRNWALLALGRTAETRKGIDLAMQGGKIPEAFLQDAALKLGQKDYARARASTEKALAQSPEDVRALHALILSYSLQNQMPIGLQKAREYAARQPKSAPIQQFLGKLLLSSGDRAGARKAFEAAAAAKPDLISVDLALAEMDANEGRRDEARKTLSAVVSSHPENVAGRLLFAQLEMTEGKNAAALDQFRKAAALDEKNALALNGLAYLLAESRQPDEALKYAQKAKELAPDNAAVDDTLGWTYFQKGLYSLAVTHLEGAANKEGTAVRKYHLAMAYLKAGDPKRGRQMLDAALEMDPNLPEAHTARQVFGMAAN